MRGIRFTDLNDDTFMRHTADDWGLVMSTKVIGTPPLKRKTVELNDRDGVLDYTTALRGVPSYGARVLTFVFEYLDSVEGWTELFSEIKGFLHGRRVKIEEPDDTNYYYLGRAEVSDPTGDSFSGPVKIFTVTVQADTWKYKNGPITPATWNAAAGARVLLTNDWRPVSPTIATTGAVSFEFNGRIYSIAGAGTFRFPTFTLGHGVNTVEIKSGSGDITFTYPEGAI